MSSVLSYLTLSSDYQIYQNLNVPAVAQSVYRGDVSSPTITFNLSGTYQKPHQPDPIQGNGF